MNQFSLKIFSKRLKDLREQRKKTNPKWTQNYVADTIGVARVTYTAYEGAKKQPPLETVNKLADLFNVSTDYLLGRTDNPYNAQVAGKEIQLSAEELKVFEEIKKHPTLFHDLATDPEKKVKQLIKMWKFIKEDLEEDDDESDIIED
ncbi:MAG: helix-turn-helix transcriptional regulator [Bacillaceae bacterium]|nr:helix-turn-helix transcriptional regulator [Bacillaceae bacterium]